MFALAARHIPRQILKRRGHKEFCFLCRQNFPIIRAAGCSCTESEGLTPKGSIRRRHEDLGSDVFLSFKSD
jgi:hypothetical protein